MSIKQEVTPMPISAKALSAQAMQLPPDERLALVDQLLDTLDEPDATLDALWAKEAESRLAAYRRGEVQALALSDVIAKYQTTPKAT
jgi:putative addiction module component (TIGR02574 family)